MAIEGAADAEVFEAYVEHFLPVVCWKRNDGSDETKQSVKTSPGGR